MHEEGLYLKEGVRPMETTDALDPPHDWWAAFDANLTVGYLVAMLKANRST